MKKSSKAPRAVIVTRPTAYEELLGQHGTPGQAAFFLESRGQSVAGVLDAHERQDASVRATLAGVPLDWRRARVDRADLDRFLFDRDDVVVAVGQDGLVANVAKYLEGQPVIGINPDPGRYDGVLARHQTESAIDLIAPAYRGEVDVEVRTMVEARADDGMRIVALNEIFVGHASNQSARYEIGFDGRQESHSSSGLIVSTGTGSTGWARSIYRQRNGAFDLPRPTDPSLAFFVREAFPSVATGCSLTEGVIGQDRLLTVTSRMNDGGVVFGDGIEKDRIAFLWGRRLTLRRASERLRLVV